MNISVRDLFASISISSAFVLILVAVLLWTPSPEFINGSDYGDRLVLVIVGIPVSLTLLFVGLLWAPFAAFICNRIARTRGMDIGRYTGAGAGYSALFFLPWIYLVLRMYGRIIPVTVIGAGYVFLYILWFSWIGGYIIFMVAENAPRFLMRYSLEAAISVTIILSVVIAINISTWLYSILTLYRTRARRCLDRDAFSRNILPDNVYVYPFKLLLLWMVVFPFVWLITYAIISP